MKHFEIECKWEANSPRAFSCARQFVASLGGKFLSEQLQIKDIYLDHADGDLAAQKIALRLRNTDGKWEATYKTRGAIKNGKAQRREETKNLPSVKTTRQALRALEQQKRWGKINLAGLKEKFSLRNKRTVYSFFYDRAELEMSLDRVTLQVWGRQVKFKEIEVELKHGNKKALDKFAACFTHQTKLKYAKISKVKTAEMFLSLWKG